MLVYYTLFPPPPPLRTVNLVLAFVYTTTRADTYTHTHTHTRTFYTTFYSFYTFYSFSLAFTWPSPYSTRKDGVCVCGWVGGCVLSSHPFPRSLASPLTLQTFCIAGHRDEISGCSRRRQRQQKRLLPSKSIFEMVRCRSRRTDAAAAAAAPAATGSKEKGAGGCALPCQIEARLVADHGWVYHPYQ